MCTTRQNMQRGQSLIEILFAMSLAVVVLSTIAYLIFNTETTVRNSAESLYAQALAQEGVAAVKSISQNSFGTLSEGTHGVLLQDGVWKFSGSNDTTGKYIRSVVLTEIDVDIYNVVSTVIWDLTAGRSKSSSYGEYVSNWEQTAGHAADLQFDVSGVLYALGGTSIEGMTVRNTHLTTDLSITQLSLQWDGGERLSEVTINGELLYSASSSEAAVSEELIDTDDILIESGGSSVIFGPLKFTGDIGSTEILGTIYLSDGSKKYIRISP